MKVLDLKLQQNGIISRIVVFFRQWRLFKTEKISILREREHEVSVADLRSRRARVNFFIDCLVLLTFHWSPTCVQQLSGASPESVQVLERIENGQREN